MNFNIEHMIILQCKIMLFSRTQHRAISFVQGLCACSLTWDSSWWSGFFPFPKHNRMWIYGGHTVLWDELASHPRFPSCTQCSWDMLWIQHNPDQDKVPTEGELMDFLPKHNLIFTAQNIDQKNFFDSQEAINKGMNTKSKIADPFKNSWSIHQSLGERQETGLASRGRWDKQPSTLTFTPR